jgi:hypothetical protein
MTGSLRAAPRPFVLALAGALATAVTSAVAVAAPPNVNVEGRIDLPPGGVKEPEVQYAGFIDRIPNAITELRPYDPRPECFVWLDGGTPGADASTPPPTALTWHLFASNFQIPLLPVVAGTNVEIKNISQTTHPLFAVDKPDLLPADPIGPGGTRSIKASDVQKAVVVRSKDSPHLEARLVALPTKYFARMKKDGSFVIEDVPPGKWTAKVWCKDGWLPITRPVDVGTRGARADMTLPERLEPAAKPASK